MKRKFFLTATFLTMFIVFNKAFAFKQTSTSSDVIIQWNRLTVKATKIAKQNTNLAARFEAIEAIAVYDAVNSIKHIAKPYHFTGKPAGPASLEAAVARAAHDILLNYFPAQAVSLDSALKASLAKASDGPVDEGEKIGAASAADIINLRANDGSEPNVTYAGPTKPGVGEHRPTPGAFAPGINQQWGK